MIHSREDNIGEDGYYKKDVEYPFLCLLCSFIYLRQRQ